MWYSHDFMGQEQPRRNCIASSLEELAALSLPCLQNGWKILRTFFYNSISNFTVLKKKDAREGILPNETTNTKCNCIVYVATIEQS